MTKRTVLPNKLTIIVKILTDFLPRNPSLRKKYNIMLVYIPIAKIDYYLKVFASIIIVLTSFPQLIRRAIHIL